MEVSGYHPPISINVTEYRVFILDDSQNGVVDGGFWLSSANFDQCYRISRFYLG